MGFDIIGFVYFMVSVRCDAIAVVYFVIFVGFDFIAFVYFVVSIGCDIVGVVYCYFRMIWHYLLPVIMSIMIKLNMSLSPLVISRSL